MTDRGGDRPGSDLVVRAPVLRPGDRVAVVAPSSAVLRTDTFETGLGVLRAWGLDPVVSRRVHEATGHLAGTDAARIADLDAAFGDRSIRGVFAARGGYGSSRIVDAVDWGLLRRDPKVVLGFSDVTALLVAAWQRVRVVTVHGPSVAGLHGLAPAARTHLRRLLTRPGPLGALEPPPGAPPVRTVTAGVAEGPLVGGNLSLLSALAGTPDALDGRGAVVLLEDVNEAPYRVDRMLVQLARSGGLADASGVVVGQLRGCDPPSDRPSATVDEVVDDVLGRLGIPVVQGVPAGHVDHQLAMPMGPRVRLDADAGTLTFLEPHLS